MARRVYLIILNPGILNFISNKIKYDKYSYVDQLTFDYLRDGYLLYQYISEESLKKSHK